ncbi:hypothetical protein P4T20_00765 [Aneurinibacillus thermoaerophilus]|uniref:hypothetical protein n=1 Tax=Aneurinibacillus TaxID=55079 RepID=UPI0012E3F38C|nr:MULTISPECIES: hypothetical protein [Aneurinibacillus]MED0677852.1 hypothetical protein [Aneurinibacillus thermoaerophilus]
MIPILNAMNFCVTNVMPNGWNPQKVDASHNLMLEISQCWMINFLHGSIKQNIQTDCLIGQSVILSFEKK